MYSGHESSGLSQRWYPCLLQYYCMVHNVDGEVIRFAVPYHTIPFKRCCVNLFGFSAVELEQRTLKDTFTATLTIPQVQPLKFHWRLTRVSLSATSSNEWYGIITMQKIRNVRFFITTTILYRHCTLVPSRHIDVVVVWPNDDVFNNS